MIKEEIYDKISQALSDFEADSEEKTQRETGLYNALLLVKDNWENVIISVPSKNDIHDGLTYTAKRIIDRDGIKVKGTGYNALAEAAAYVVEDASFVRSMSTNLYVALAEKYETTAKTLENVIARAVKMTYPEKSAKDYILHIADEIKLANSNR